MQSGSVNAPWAVADDLVTPTKEIAKLCQCNTGNDQEIADCLRKTPVDDLIRAHQVYVVCVEVCLEKYWKLGLIGKSDVSTNNVSDCDSKGWREEIPD